jgi:hypothetical protein
MGAAEGKSKPSLPQLFLGVGGVFITIFKNITITIIMIFEIDVTP